MKTMMMMTRKTMRCPRRRARLQPERAPLQWSQPWKEPRWGTISLLLFQSLIALLLISCPLVLVLYQPYLKSKEQCENVAGTVVDQAKEGLNMNTQPLTHLLDLYFQQTIPMVQEVLSKARDVAGAAVDQAKEGLSKAYSSAKNLVSGFASGKADEKGASEL